MKVKVVVVFMSMLLLTFGSVGAIIVIERSTPYGRLAENLGRGLGAGMEQGLAQAMARQREEERLRDLVVTVERERYATVTGILTATAAHPDIRIPPEHSECIEKTTCWRRGNKHIDYTCKAKFSRVLEDGKTVERMWSVDVVNKSQRGLFSSDHWKNDRFRLNVQMLDSDDLLLAECISYGAINVKPGERATFRGRWFIPFDQMKQVTKLNLIAEEV